jgi:predicted RNase H-like nuclease (RuvC/YqgF family)
MATIVQTHSGSGDNIGGNKIDKSVKVNGSNSGVINTGNHNKIDVKITTTNNELENLLDELKAEINQIKTKLSDADKKQIDKHLARLEADIKDKDEDEVKGSLEKISKIASIVEAGGKILEYKEKIIEFLGFGG